MNSYKVPLGTSFKEFYYQALSFNSSFELSEYVKANKWYFDKMTPEVQEQFRNFWLSLKKEEEIKNEFFR